jgi:uncharacterized protein YxjI
LGTGGFLNWNFLIQRNLLWTAKHPFRFYFERLEVYSPQGVLLGTLDRKWSVFSKSFELTDSQNGKRLEMYSGLFSFWTFPFVDGEREVAMIKKRWGGVLKEVFIDADTFFIDLSAGLPESTRKLIITAGIFVDLQYFEKKAD